MSNKNISSIFKEKGNNLKKIIVYFKKRAKYLKKFCEREY